MKILYWSLLFWPSGGGIETVAMKLLPALRRRRHECIVVASHSGRDLPDETQYDGIPVHRFAFLRALAENDTREILTLRRRVAKLKRGFQPDLIHLHFPGHIAYFHMSTLTAYPAPTLVSVHTDFHSMRGGPDTLLGQTLRSAAWVAGVSRATLTDVCEMVPDIRDRSSVVYNGLDEPTLPPAALPFDPPVILCAGRLVKEKGFDVALAAFREVVHDFPRARLIVAGDGPERGDLERRAAEMGLGSAVEFLGRIEPEKMPALINRCTVTMIPSRYREPFAMIAVEAAQMARPVVATRFGGLTETVVDGETGILVEPENSSALCKATAFLLASPERAAAMGRRGRARALDVFSLDKCADAYDALYHRIKVQSAPQDVDLNPRAGSTDP
jgi:glycosyltransferase involved in cell wall biosynthesis